MRRSVSRTQGAVIAGVILAVAAVAWPGLTWARRHDDLSTCVSNMHKVMEAEKPYEADYGASVVHMGPDPGEAWTDKVAPYLYGRDDVLVCPADTTHGVQNRWGGARPSSYLFYYTRLYLGPHGAYREPEPASPMIGCEWHTGYQMLIGRYDGCIELVPPFRYPNIMVHVRRSVGRDRP